MSDSNIAGWKKTFLLIWVGQAFSLFGSELVQFALVWYLTKQTGSASVLAMASFVALLPKVFLSPFIGALIDRWNRQRVMIFADLGIAFFSLLLALMFWLGNVQVWHIYLVMFMRAVGSSFHWPSMQASTTMLVPKDSLSRVSGWNQTLQGAMSILAPMAAALLLDLLPMQGILAIDIITALMAILPLLFVVIPQPILLADRPIMSGVRDLLRDVRQGFQYLSGWKGMLYMILAATILNFALNPGYTFMPLLVKDYFKMGAFELSLIDAVFGIGMIVGGLVLGAWGGFKKKVVTILAGIIGLSFSTLVVALAGSYQFYMAVAGLSVSGFMLPMANGPLAAVLQSNIEPDKQGRVFTLVGSLTNAMMPLSMLVAAPVAEWIGIRGWLGLAAGICFLIGAGGFLIPALLNLEDPRYQPQKLRHQDLSQNQ
jgi:DHA3 family macrolide efflux protein-like MFS transporter